MARLAAGEREGPVIELYARYGGRLYALGVHLLGDRAAAEELVQETFIRLWQTAARFDPSQASTRSWLLMLARRCAVDMLRRSAARPRSALHHRGAGGELENPLDSIPDEDEVDRLLVSLDVRAPWST